MNRFLCTALLLFALGSLAAQTGLFGLSYGDSLDKVKELLSTEPLDFVVDSNDGIEYTFVPQDNEYIDHIVAYFSEDKSALMMWQVSYIEQAEESAEDVAYESAYEWHGEETDWDDDFELYIWDLGEGKTLKIGYDVDWWITAEYSSPGYEAYSVFY